MGRRPVAADGDGLTARAIRYDRSAASLFFPGRADDFFARGAEVDEAALFAEMARLAYVRHERGDGETERLARSLGRVGFTLRDPFDAAGTQGFVADGRTPASGAVRVIAFRGTEPGDPRDTLADLDARAQPWRDGATVHRGFARALAPVQARVTAAMDTAPDAVVLTGHSLGAALASLAASLRPDARLCTLGSPRVGDAAFARLVAGPRHARYVDWVDVVTRVPPHGFGFGYVHAEPAHFIDEQGDVHPGLTDEAVRERQAAAGGRDLGVVEVARMLVAEELPRERGLPWRDLTDHAPINYVAALMRLPA